MTLQDNNKASIDVHRRSDNGDGDQTTEEVTTARTDLPLDQLETKVTSNYSHCGVVATSIQQEAVPRDVATAESDVNHDSSNATTHQTVRQDLEQLTTKLMATSGAASMRRMRQEQKETSQMQTLLQLEQLQTEQSQQEQQIEQQEQLTDASKAQVLPSLHQNGQPQAQQQQSEDAGKHTVLQSPQELDDSLPSRLTTTEEGGGIEPPRLTRNRNMIANSGIPGAYAVAPPGHREDNDNFISDDDPEHQANYHGDNNDVAVPAAMANAEEGLAQAQPIMEDEENQPTAVGTPTMPQHAIQEMRDQKFQAWYKKILVLFLLILGVVIAIVIGLTVKNNTQNDDGIANTNALTSTPSVSPTVPPTLAPTPHVLPLPDYTLQAMMVDPESPQAMAYQWLKEDPFLQEYSESKLAQRFALATFYYATGGGNWTINDNWLSYNRSECDWFSKFDAIPATEGGYVLDENFGWKFLQMTRTAGQSVCDVDGNYRELVLPQNELARSLPAELSFLSKLEILDIANNQISSNIPTQIGLLSNLKEIFLDENPLTGSLVSEIGSMSSIEVLGMTWTMLTSTIPTELGLVSSMKELWLSNNPFTESLRITGSVPRELFQMRNLSILALRNTGISGALPTEIGFLSQLQVIDIIENQLTHMPIELHELTNIIFFRYYGNLVHGPIPSEYGVLSKLENLEIGINMHTGQIPSELGLLQSLVSLSVSKNDLTGSVPSEVFLLRELELLDLGYNLHLQGSIPTSVGLLSNIDLLDLSEVKFTGRVPSEIALMSDLWALYLRFTALTGSLPSELAQNAELQILELEGSNGLTGALPPFPQNQSFWRVKINGTSLSGTVPDNMCDSRFETWFDCPPMCGCDCVCPNDTALLP